MKKYTLQQIKLASARRFRVAPEQLTAYDKTVPASRARQMYYLIARQQGYSTTQIGNHISRDHTSTIHGSRKMQKLLADYHWQTQYRAVMQDLAVEVA